MNKYKQINLSKGGKLFYVKNKINNSTMVRIAFDCGSRCDTIPGLAHFVEHVFFSGTKTMSRDDINKKYFNFIGSNASTSNGDICFRASLFTKEFEEYVKTVAMIVTETTFEQKELDKEIGIVQQEIAREKDKHNRNVGRLNRLNLTELPFYEKYDSLGTDESVAIIKQKDVVEFVKKYFVANNLRVYVTSPLRLGKVKNIIERELVSKLTVDPEFEKLPYFISYVKNATFKKLETKDINKNYIMVNFNNPHTIYDFEYRAKAGLVLDMINDFSTGLLKVMREERSLVYSGSVYTELRNDKETLISFYTECATKNVNPVLETLSEYIQKIAKEGFTEEQLKQAKRMTKYNHETSEPRLGRLLFKLTDFETFGKIIRNDISKLMKKVTLEECNEIFKEMFLHNQISYTIYGSIKKEELISDEKFDELFKNN